MAVQRRYTHKDLSEVCEDYRHNRTHTALTITVLGDFVTLARLNNHPYKYYV